MSWSGDDSNSGGERETTSGGFCEERHDDVIQVRALGIDVSALRLVD